MINDDNILIKTDDDGLGRSWLMTPVPLILGNCHDYWLTDWLIGDYMMTIMGGDYAVGLMMFLIDYDTKQGW